MQLRIRVTARLATGASRDHLDVDSQQLLVDLPTDFVRQICQAILKVASDPVARETIDLDVSLLSGGSLVPESIALSEAASVAEKLK